MIDQTPPPPARDLPAGHHDLRRTHLLNELSGRRVSPRRLLIGGLATAGLAGGLAAAVVIGPTAKVGDKAPGAQAEAAAILTRAAGKAATLPELKPGPQQFLYFESKSTQSSLPGQPGGRQHRKAWLSASGKRAGLLETDDPGMPGGVWLCSKRQPDGAAQAEKIEPKIDLNRPPTGCENPPAYRPDLPTNAGAMRKWLYRNRQGGNPPDVQAFITVGDTLREAYVPPAALAAMFQAAAKIPGITVTPDVTDPAGRKGIAVGQTWHGNRHELIFDAKSYLLLGERAVVDYDNSFRPSGGSTPETRPWEPPAEMKATMKEGQVLYADANLMVAVTDRVGQRP